MKILIMAAGRGQRFRTGGFEIPKPLIRYKDIPMIEWAIREFPQIPRHDIIIVGIPEVCHYVRGAHPEIRTVSVEYTQNGPAMSALLAGGLIRDDESFVMVDCDVILHKGHVQQFALDLAEDTRIEGGLIFTTIEGDSSAYCSITLKNEYAEPTTRLANRVASLEEKTGGSQHIAVGIYGFKHWRQFRANAMYLANSSFNELYISKVLQFMIKEGQGKCNIRGTWINEADWTCLGTPKEFEEASR